MTAGAAPQSPARHVAVVELEPAVVEASLLSDDINGKPLQLERLRLHADGARHLLLASDDLYDVIISEPSHPWVSGISDLLTRDFFSLAASRLRADGLFAQWLQTYQIAGETFRTILGTFQSVFPEALVFRSQGTDLILVGSRRPGRLDVTLVEQRFGDSRTRRASSSSIERMGRMRLGMGLAGSETYSSKGAPPSSGASHPKRPPAPR